MNVLDRKEIIKTDGKRRIKVADTESKFSREGDVDLSFCINGSQQTIISIDQAMLVWLKEAIDEYKASANE